MRRVLALALLLFVGAGVASVALEGPGAPRPVARPRVGDRLPHVGTFSLGLGAPIAVGELLVATNGTWSGTVTGYAYQWQDCNSSGMSCSNVASGGTSQSYTVKTADEGDTLVVVVTATGPGGSTSASSAATGLVAGGGGGSAPANTAAPAISGIPTVGTSLSVSNGTWTNSPTSYTYQWQDCNASGGSCSNIGGATSSSYTMANSDTLSSIQAVVTAHNGSGTGAASGITGPEPMMFSRVTYDYSSSLSDSAEASRYQILDMQSTDASTAGTLRADNPNLITLMYADPMFDNSGTTNVSTGTACVPWATVNANNSWFATKSSARIQNTGYPGTWLMDPDAGTGSGTFANTCAADEIAADHSNGFQGTFWDDQSDSTYIGFSESGGFATDQYSATAWDSDFHALSTYLTTQLNAASPSLVSIANVAVANLTNWESVANGVNGMMHESWGDGGLGTAQQDPYWSLQLASTAYDEAHDKYTMLIDQDSSEGGNGYGLAMSLLVANGYTSTTLGYGTSGNYTSAETWWPNEYNTALQLGPATGAYTTPTLGGVSVYERKFANGIVLANPSQSATSSFTIPGGVTYSGPNCSGNNINSSSDGGSCSTLTHATTMTLGTDGGAILLTP